jgi:hypothetical protein
MTHETDPAKPATGAGNAPRESWRLRHPQGSTVRLVSLVVGPLLSFYALCWLVATVTIPIKVELALPQAALSADALATLNFEDAAPQAITRAAPLQSPLAFDFQVGIGSLRHFLERVDHPSVKIDITGCNPLELPLMCGPWTIRAPNYFVLGSWSASLSQQCTARGTALCPALESRSR